MAVDEAEGAGEGIRWQRRDLVPLSQRLRFLQRYRIAAVGLTVALQLWGLASGSVDEVLVIGGIGIGLGAVAGVVVRRRHDVGGRWLFGVVLLGDGVLLAALSYLSGGLGTPPRFLILLHLVIVTLVASYRTGVKLAVWHSLLMLLVHEAGAIGWFADPDVPSPTEAVAVQLVLTWLVTLVTASASAVNEREILRRRYDLNALASMSHALESVSDVHGVAGTLTDHVADTFGARRAGVISLRDGDPLPLAGRGLAPVTTAGTITGLLEEVATSRSTILVAGLGEDDAWLRAQFPKAGRVAGVPLFRGDEVTEVLLVDFADTVGERLERRVVTTLERFADHGALALENARLHAELVASAETDGLTGVANRGAFDRRLSIELARLERNGGTLALILCDLDHFKVVNDTHGHATGDAVLIHVAQLLAQASRPYDTVARFGGEEFAVLMPAAPSYVAASTARRYCIDVATSDSPVPVTVSVGVVAVEGPADAMSVIRAADDALYRSKREGRNRVTEAPVIVAPASEV